MIWHEFLSSFKSLRNLILHLPHAYSNYLELGIALSETKIRTLELGSFFDGVGYIEQLFEYAQLDHLSIQMRWYGDESTSSFLELKQYLSSPRTSPTRHFLRIRGLRN